MNKNIKALLCVAALLGSISTLSVKAEDVIVNEGETRSYDSATNISGNVINSGIINISATGGMEDVATLENNSTGTINNSNSIVANTIINYSSGTFNNSKSTVTDNLTNDGTFGIASGNLTINQSGNGQNNGEIHQYKITVGTDAIFTNGNGTDTATIVSQIENNGEFTNKSNSRLGHTGTLPSITNNKTFTNEGSIHSYNLTNTGSFENKGTIGSAGREASIRNNSGTFTNSGNIAASSITNGSGANFTNNGIISEIATLTNSGTISGTGSLNVKGGSNGVGASIEQAVTMSGTFTNRGNISASVTNTTDGDQTNEGTITGPITNNGTYTNNGIITGDITNTSGTFTNAGNIGDAGNGIKVNITNSDKFINNNSVVADTILNNTGATFTNNKTIVTDTFTNNNTISGNNGTLTVNTSGTNNGSITQNKVTVASGATLTNGNGTNNATIISAVENNGTLENKAGSSIGTTTNKVSITNKGTFNNGGEVIASAIINDAGKTLTNSNNVVADVVNNAGIIEGIGNLEFKGNSTNSGSITQNIVKITDGTLNNTGTLTANGEFTNDAAISGNGTLNINAGGTSNTAITQGNVTISGTFNNNETLTASTKLTNKGTINTIANISAADLDNQAGKTITGNAELTANGGSNSGTITTTSFETTGNFVNNSGASIGNNDILTNITNTSGTFTNSGNITAGIFDNNSTLSNSQIINATIFNNTSRVEGTGSLNVVNGSNSTNGHIAQAITNTGAYTNSGTISGDVTNNATYINNGTISGAITSDGTSFTNNKTITGDITNTSGTFTNTGNIGDAGNGIKVNITNSDKFINNNSVVAAEIVNNKDASITNAKTIIADKITNNIGASINGGTLQIGSGTNSGSIDIAITKVTGDFENTSDFIAGTFENDHNFTGTGNLTITDGSKNTGSITQDEVTVNNKLSIGSGKSLISKILTNKGTITNDNGTITTESITENNTIVLKNAASLSATKQTNPLTGLIKSLGSGTTNSIAVAGNIEGTLSVEEGSTLALTQGNVVKDAVVNITSNSTFDIKNTSDVIINGDDTWNGKIALNGGELNVQGRTQNGALSANTGALTLETGKLDITSGSIIKDAVTTIIKENTTLNILNGGKVTLANGDTWAQDIKDADGNITSKGATIVLGEAGTPAQIATAEQLQQVLDDIKAGNDLPEDLTILDVKGLDNKGTLKANNGLLLFGDKNLDIQGESYIKKAVAMELGSNINISNGGEVTIDDNDIITSSNPTVTLKGGTLNYGKMEDSGLKIEADTGNLNLLGGSNLTFNAGNIADAVAIDIQEKATLRLDGSTLNLDSLDQWNGNIVNKNGIINANGLTKSSSTATLTQADGELNLYNNTNLTLGSESKITGGDINITKDKEDITGSTGSRLTIYSGADKDSQVISNGDMTIDKDSSFIVATGTFNLNSLKAYGAIDENGAVQAALINTMNGERNTSSIGTLSSDSIANFNIDIHARTNTITSNDQFVIGSMGDGTIRIDKWALNGDIFGWDAPIDRDIILGNIFMDKNGNAILNGKIAVTNQETFTPIGWYKLNKNDLYEDVIDPDSGLITGSRLAGSNYSLNLTRFNPQVFRGQVATIAQWQNQLAIDDILFNHTMLLPSFKEEKGNKPSKAMTNQYSAINPLFSPYQYSIKDGGLWYKMYGTFEHLNMNNGLGRVGNNAYGALIGADFGLKELKNGWKFMPTAYIGYNGAHQYWAGMGQYQNGGQAGFMGTWYKDNFIVSSLTYGGIYDNSMSVHGHNENTFNYFAGTAAKAAYNWRFHRNWVLQPNLMAAYNYFGQQNWHSDFGQMGMMAGMLHGVNIAPGVNLIWEKETFSTYLTLQYMYNVNGAVGGKAGNVGLPQVEMDRGYIQYGIGFTKKFTDRASGYLQAVLRNVGRTGVGFQAGFNFQIGK